MICALKLQVGLQLRFFSLASWVVIMIFSLASWVATENFQLQVRLQPEKFLKTNRFAL
jgi:hypothetical protein